ncbi:DUF4259 domain-containing protein [Streptomyces sp. NPDC060064]|uniref:DUF4259 domain-containing protein n=1 Tax=Streptomyces sp. NPDC060064 TaxID=3347049 RepID=UPI0036899C7F
MGAWGIGPLDKRGRRRLRRRAGTADSLDASDAMRAVAAAALVVAPCPGGEPACPHYGPSDPMPEFPIGLRMLAVDALNQVVAEPSEVAELYYEALNSRKEWRPVLKPSTTPWRCVSGGQSVTIVQVGRCPSRDHWG